MSGLFASIPLRWIVALIAYPIGGYIGFVVGGPAATVPAAAISGLVTGAFVGLAQGLAVKLPPQELALWTVGTAVALSVALGATTAAIGQISSSAEAVGVGAVSGFLIGAAQAALLFRERMSSAAVWVVASGVAWAVGWFVTTGIGVSTATGWPVYGLSGALASQVITAVVLWKLIPDDLASLEAA
jgi:hypothetical protein